MCAVNQQSLKDCRRELHNAGYRPIGCSGPHGHGNTIWRNEIGELAEITLDKCTGCFVLFCPFHPAHHTTKETLRVIEGVPEIITHVVRIKEGF